MGVAFSERVAEFQTGALPPLVVDLDSALVKSDLLIESLLALLKKNPLYVFLLPVWLVRGKAWFKQQVASRVTLDVSLLPWRTEFIDSLMRQRAEGRMLVLATGNDIRIARQAAGYLKLFDMVLASDHLAPLFGEKGFDYAARPDSGARGDLGVLRGLKALRPAHWLKNLLIFVPLFAAHRFYELALLEKSLLAFVAFGCCASSGYLLNDLNDLDSDRHHPQKRFRAFASGDLPLSYALTAIPLLLFAGCYLGALVSPLFCAILLAYFIMSASYSLYLKKIVLLDVLFLAGLYTIRIMAGSVATGVGSSHWLVAFSTFLFFSLALVKRYSELMIMRREDGDGAKARAYELGDSELLAAMGTASGYLAVLVLALYINSDTASVLYGRRELLWLLCPLLLYWISHVWLTAHRGKMRHDPVEFAMRDRISRTLILAMLATATLAW